jgi:hypothetical protein
MYVGNFMVQGGQQFFTQVDCGFLADDCETVWQYSSTEQAACAALHSKTNVVDLLLQMIFAPVMT